MMVSQICARASHITSITLAMLLLAACNAGETPSSTTSSAPATPPVPVGTTVQVSVSASDPNNDQLHYRWAATEGTISNVDAPNTTWTIPPGSGLSFAYVLVSDGKGGYTESRAAVMTQSVPTPSSNTSVPAPSQPANSNYIWGTLFFKGTLGRNVYLPGMDIELSGPTNFIRTVQTDKKGEFFFSGLGQEQYTLSYTIPGRPRQPFSTPVTLNPTSPRSYIEQEVAPATLTGTLQIAGSTRLIDTTHCGIRNEFFTDSNLSNANALRRPESASAQLLTSTNGPLGSSTPVNHYGDYLIVTNALANPTDVKVRIHCEQGFDKDSALIQGAQSGLRKALPVVLDNSRPRIQSIAVLLNGQDIGRPDLPKPRTLVPKFQNDPLTFPDADLIAEFANTPGDDTFLGYKGIDTRMGACRYYQAIRAVEECDASGFPTGAQLTLEAWKKRFNLSPFQNDNTQNPRDPNTPEARIIYINRADLNFARDMQAVRLSDGSIAYNVCNYAGPQNTTGLGEPVDIGTELQPNIDLAIDNARRGIGMVACVAMDYSVTPGVNGNLPFTKFYTFGPSGKLLLSVSLDGRREKFMPGSCTACHGGDFHGGQFPQDGSGRPDIGSRWQPFDMANLDFATSQKTPGNDPTPEVHAAIKQLNQMLVPPGAFDPLNNNGGGGGLPSITGGTVSIAPATTLRTKELIDGWYQTGTRTTQNLNFVPQLYASDETRYRLIGQKMCQTCHAAQRLNENFSSTFSNMICGSATNPKLADNHTMTNALVPFERLWRDPSLPPLLGCSPTPIKHPDL